MWQTFGEYVANKLQQCGDIRRMRGKRIAIMQHSKSKNHTFVTQKPPFCTSKTILLYVKNHTFVMRICNIQKTNTLQTPTKWIANTPQYTHVHPRNWLRTDCQSLLTVCQNAAKHAASFALRTTMHQHTNIKKRIKFTTEYEENNTNGKHLHHHFPTLICAKTPFTIKQSILVRHIHTVWRGVHRPNFNHNKRI